jgi:hypothetical protein
MQFPDADTPVDPWLWSQVILSGDAQDCEWHPNNPYLW